MAGRAFVLHDMFGMPSDEVRGAETVASHALSSSRVDLTVQRALINGAAGLVSTRDGQPFSVGAFTVKDGKIAEIDILAGPDRLALLDLTVLGA
jgi:hypothetical protein